MSSLMTKDSSYHYDMLVHGYCRRLNRKQVPVEIIRICILFSDPNVYWKISSSDIISKLNEDFTTLEGPKIILNNTNLNFILKLKRSTNCLFFGAWYQGNNRMQQELYKHFKKHYNEKIADKIVKSFNYITKEEEFDIESISTDFEEISASCILDYVEDELLRDLTLFVVGDVDQSIKLDIKRIMSRFCDSNSKSVIFRVRIKCQERNLEFRKLYKFNQNQLTEKGAEMQWRNKYNHYTDCSLHLNMFENFQHITYQCFIEILNDGITEYLRCNERETYLCYNWKLEDDDKLNEIKNMTNGQHLYSDKNFGDNERFCLCIAVYNGIYHIYLQLLLPPKGDHVKIDYVHFKLVCTEPVFRRIERKHNIKMNAKNDMICWKFGDKEFIKNISSMQISVDILLDHETYYEPQQLSPPWADDNDTKNEAEQEEKENNVMNRDFNNSLSEIVYPLLISMEVSFVLYIVYLYRLYVIVGDL